MADGTAALRSAAAHWSLAGDQQLLNLLQDIHQRIVTKCNETTEKLDQMSKGLRDASVNLQNVNNKFLALSNTQFVESRVYEDDADVTAPPVVSEEPPQISDLTSEVSKLKQSLQILESYHEPLHILRDSDSDSDSDEGDDRLVLKPKDLYAERPLPFIIGTPQWKAKWHAGLVVEDSDTDSSVSAAEEADQYSESDDEVKAPQNIHMTAERKISTDSSSLQSEAVSVCPARPTAADVAAELARRLGGSARIPEREPVCSEPETVVRKLYKPQQPTATIFPDEPPPLEESSDDDIFAELHKTSPKVHSSSVQNDLFDFSKKNNELEQALFGERQIEPVSTESKKSALFEDDIQPEIKNTSVPENVVKEDNVKKPVGGISLFGTNKHAESIGAAILKRNRRKSSTSEKSHTEEVKEVKEVNTTAVVPKEVKKERDIFDDLFAKSEKLNKKNTKNVEVQKEVKKDLFSDLFDDIDDIFSSDIVVKKDSKNVKPLFTDDDDLFADISKNTDKQTDKNVSADKSDLFNEDKPKIKPVDTKISNLKETKIETKGLFDSDSDDGLFMEEKPKDTKEKVTKETKEKDEIEKPLEHKINDDIIGDDDDDLFNKNKPLVKEVKYISKVIEKGDLLFDSDDELFTNNVKEIKTTKGNKIAQDNNNLLATASKETSKGTIICNIDGAEDLFKTNEKSKALKVVESINNDIFIDGDELFKKTEPPKPNKDIIYEKIPSDKSSINTDEKTDLKPEETAEIANIVESVNNDIFDKNDELLTKIEPKEFKIEPSDDILDTEEKSNNKNKTATTDSKDTGNTKDDFTDEPINDFYKPYEQTNILRTTRIASAEETIKTEKSNHDMFDDADELFKTSVTKPKSNIIENKEITQTKTVATDIFSDIFDDVPPIFEKPKEPKRSKNVNALFDDDSDDEALFFKKNDVITDDKPDFSPSGERFVIFNEEPPALDIDFTQKSNKNDIPEKAQKPEDKVDNSEYYSNSDKIQSIAPEVDKIITETSEDTIDNTTKAAKKVGKLKPMHFNINVNTLLPGASPKKKIEDEQYASNEDLHKTDKIESNITKSVSFDDPEILDNKISKERAKIQVKRRPSTRRARKEAVRKSAIDMTDSFDSPEDNVKDVKVKTVYILNDADIFGDTIQSKNTETKRHLNIVDSDEELFKTDTKNDEVKKGDDLFKDKNSQLNEEKSKENKLYLNDDNDDIFEGSISIQTDNKPATSEDNIFSKIDDKSEEIRGESYLGSDDDELFKTKTTKKLETNYSSDDDLFRPKKGIETLGKVYETKDFKVNTNIEKKTHSIFDDFPAKPKDVKIDDEIIKPKEMIKEKPVEKVVKSILDESSDEDDLFKSKTKLSVKKEGKSLFGDDLDDGDDLFGQKTVKEQKQDVPVPQTSKELKPAETVFVDPLSLFGDDE